MTFAAKGAFTGLMTSVAETQAPAGALRRAHNVVIRRAGAIEPRESYQPYALLPVPYFHAEALDAVEFDGELNSYNGNERWARGHYSPPPFNTPTNQPFARMRQDALARAFLRGNFYFPHARGVSRVTSSTSGEWVDVGLPITFAVRATPYLHPDSSQRWLPNNCRVAYRVVAKKTLPNGLIVRSRPSGAVVVSNVTGANMAIAIAITMPFDPYGVDEFEVYRTRVFPTTSVVDDVMQLAATSANATTVIDTVLDAQRGASLYTGPDQQGMGAANDQPPAAACAETYKGCLFLGNVAGPQRIIFSHGWGNRSGQATGVGIRTCGAVAMSAGSATATVSSAVGLQIGMCLVRHSQDFGAAPSSGTNVGGTLNTPCIVGIAGNTVTLDRPSSVAAVSATWEFADAVRLDGRWYPLGRSTTYGIDEAPSALGELFSTTYNTPEPFVSYAITPPRSGYAATMVVEHLQKNGAAFAIAATHGDEFSPPMTSATSRKDVYPNGLVWSAVDEPDHFPTQNFVFVGDRAKALLGIKATRDSLWIFKEDGVWRLSGVNGQWRIDAFDPTSHVCLPSSIEAMDGRVYALATKGVIAVDESGVEVVSMPIANLAARLVDDIIRNYTADGYYHVTTGGAPAGRAACVDIRHHEYTLLTGMLDLTQSGDADEPYHAIRYNALTGAWTTLSWRFGDQVRGLSVDRFGTPLLLGAVHTKIAVFSSAYDPSSPAVEERYPRDDLVPRSELYADVNVDATLALDRPGARVRVTLSSAPSWAIRVGDVIAQVGSMRGMVITEVETQTTLIVDARPGMIIGNGMNRVHRVNRYVVEAHGNAQPILANKRAMHAVWATTKMLGVGRLDAVFSGAGEKSFLGTFPETRQTIDFDRVETTPYPEGALLRANVPRDHARAWLLRTRLEAYMLYGDFSIEGFAVDVTSDAPNRDSTKAAVR